MINGRIESCSGTQLVSAGPLLGRLLARPAQLKFIRSADLSRALSRQMELCKLILFTGSGCHLPVKSDLPFISLASKAWLGISLAFPESLPL